MNKKFYYYKIFNLDIKSQTPIKALDEVKQPSSMPDILITIGKTPNTLLKPLRNKNLYYQMAENEFLFFNESLGLKFYAKNGTEIIIDKDCMGDTDNVSLFLLGSVMGATLYMRNYLPLHASTILSSRGAVMFTGISGVGKSTIAYALYKRGYKVISDDIAPLKLENNKLFLYSSYPKMKLWENALDLNKVSGNFPQIKVSFNKYYVSYDPLDQNQALPIYKIYNLEIHNDHAVSTLDKTIEKDRFKIIYANSYRNNYINGLNKQSTFFEIATKLARYP
ncbi:MAG: hypothetical protein ABIA04_05005 [Pseudomonadota bacterium]